MQERLRTFPLGYLRGRLRANEFSKKSWIPAFAGMTL
jgi:hypothetical protein